MRRCMLSLAVFFMPVVAIAQTTPPPYTAVSSFKVVPGESARWEDVARQIVDAAGKAKLKPQFGWGTWQSDNTYAIVGSMQKLAELDDPMMWMRQFDNTPGQAVLMQAFQKMAGMHYREEDEVMQNVADWSYMPAAPGQAMWAEVIDYWVVGGSDEQFDKMTKEGIAILRSINFPFVVFGSRAPIGRLRKQFVILFDDPGKYAAVNAQLEHNAQWQALGVRFMPILVDMQTTRWRARPDLSYHPKP